jgi:heat shock protein 4
MSVVGVDFGAKHSVIAAAGRGGVDVILNGNSQRLNPTMVGFDQSRSMGEGAASTALSNYKNTITDIKRLVGLAFDDPRAKAEMARVAYKCVPLKHTSGGPDGIAVQVNLAGEQKIIPIEAVAGMMVKHMGSVAAAKAASESNCSPSECFPNDWVVSVPGYYTDAQRRAFLAGCEMNGVKVQRLMNESTATALAYGIFKDIRKEFTKDQPTHVMFIDMGATTYSVSIVDFQPGKLMVKSAQYDTDLGGRDFDAAIAEWLATKFEEKYKGKLSGSPRDNAKVMLKLFVAAEKAKKTLSPAGVKEARINLECIMDDLDFGISLKANEYKEMCQPLLDRLAAPINRALEESGLKASDLTSVEIVGGATRVGSVKETIAGVLGLDLKAVNNGLSTTMNADEAVARGCALQSAILSPRFKVLPYEVIEYQPFPIKIEWDGADDGMEVEANSADPQPTNSVVMFERGCNFPIVRRVTLKKSGKFSVSASYHESADNFQYPDGVDKNIATFQINAPADAEAKIRVNVKQDIHGSLTLSSAQMVEEIPEPEEEATPPAEDGAEAKTAEEGAEAKAEEKKEAKKPKLKKTNLEFSINRPLDWTQAELQREIEVEVDMSNADRVVRETADARNELESYIYDMRDKIISESQLASFCTEEEKSSFSTLLENFENWLYEDGFDATKSVYVSKLAELKKCGDPIESRSNEAKTRPNAMAMLQKTIEKYTSWLNTSSGDENYAHITEEERAKCQKVVDDSTAWMYDMLDKQGGLAANVDPVVTVAQIYAKNQEVSNTVSPIMHKPKPKPKAEEKKQEPADEPKKDEEAETKKEESAETETAEPMDTSEPMEEDKQ